MFRHIFFTISWSMTILHLGNYVGSAFGKFPGELPIDRSPLKLFGSTAKKVFYQDSENRNMSWDEASKFCRNYQMNLAMIETPKENEVFREVLRIPDDEFPEWKNSKYYWLGGANMGNEGHFVWVGINGKSQMDYSNWEIRRPVDEQIENCIRTTEDGFWSATPCYHLYQPICQSEDHLDLVAEVGTKKFYTQSSVTGEKKLNWDDAMELCHQYPSMTLGSFTTQEEVDAIFTFASKQKSDAFWTGLCDYEVEGIFQWLTGEDFEFPEIWGENEPSGDKNKNCVYLLNGDGENKTALLINDTCFKKFRPMCQIDSANKFPHIGATGKYFKNGTRIENATDVAITLPTTTDPPDITTTDTQDTTTIEPDNIP